MEALHMLKFHLKKDRLNFTVAWMMTEKQIVDDGPNGDLLTHFANGNFQEGLDHIIKSINNDKK